MSRSNPTDNLINPALRFFDFSASGGVVQYFDKSLGEKGENVAVDMPFKFLVLDRVSQVTGGIDRGAGYVGFWSNAVRNLKVQPFTVRSKGGIEAQGLYDAIKGYPGAKFMTGLYIAFYDEAQALQIGYLKLKGASLTAWIDFGREHKDIYAGAFGITDCAKKKKGTNSYYEPVFTHYPKVSDEADAQAKELDVHLQEYLTAYFAQQGLQEVEAQYSGNGHEHYDTNGEPPELPPVNLDSEPEADFAF